MWTQPQIHQRTTCLTKASAHLSDSQRFALYGLSAQLSKVALVLPGSPFPVARLRLLSVSLGGSWQAGTGPGISSCWPTASAGGMAVNPWAACPHCATLFVPGLSLKPTAKLQKRSAFPLYRQGCLRSTAVSLGFTMQSRKGCSPGNPQPLQHAST